MIVVKKSDIIEKGDAICKKSNDANDGPKGDTPAAIATYLKAGLASSRADLKAIEALGTPDKDAGQLKTAIEDANTYFDQVEKAIPAFEKDPNAEIPPAMLKAQKTAEASAKDFGFKVCGAGASSSSSTTTTTA